MTSVVRGNDNFDSQQDQWTVLSPVALTGASVDVPDFPDWVSVIDININGVSANGTGQNGLLQLGTASGVVAAGYVGGVGSIQGASANYIPAGGNGAWIGSYASAANTWEFDIRLRRLGSDTWQISLVAFRSDLAAVSGIVVSPALGAPLARLRFSMGGGQVFDAGTAYIAYRG